MKKLKDLDFWSTMILVGVLATIGCGIWNVVLRKQRDEVEAAWNAATKQHGQVATIIARLREIRALEASQSAVENIDPAVYLQTQMQNGGIPIDRFKVTKRERKDKVRVGKRGRQQAVIEEEVDLDFKAMQNTREPVFYRRKVIYYGIFNAESQSPVWKLRQLRLVSREQKTRKRGKTTIQPPLSDEWYIEKMTFVSRREG